MTLVGKGLVDGRLEASDVLDGNVLRVGTARPHILVQCGENLRVEHLEPPNTVHHSLQLLQKNII